VSDGWYQTTDAQAWARAFAERFTVVSVPPAPPDVVEDTEDTMAAWFANAIERGRSAGQAEVVASYKAAMEAMPPKAAPPVPLADLNPTLVWLLHRMVDAWGGRGVAQAAAAVAVASTADVADAETTSERGWFLALVEDVLGPSAARDVREALVERGQ
jgi:hypothetical protein